MAGRGCVMANDISAVLRHEVEMTEIDFHKNVATERRDASWCPRTKTLSARNRALGRACDF